MFFLLLLFVAAPAWGAIHFITQDDTLLLNFETIDVFPDHGYIYTNDSKPVMSGVPVDGQVTYYPDDHFFTNRWNNTDDPLESPDYIGGTCTGNVPCNATIYVQNVPSRDWGFLLKALSSRKWLILVKDGDNGLYPLNVTYYSTNPQTTVFVEQDVLTLMTTDSTVTIVGCRTKLDLPMSCTKATINIPPVVPESDSQTITGLMWFLIISVLMFFCYAWCSYCHARTSSNKIRVTSLSSSSDVTGV